MNEDAKINTKEGILKVVSEYLKGNAFTARKLTDTPTDALSTVNRRFVTNNGTTTNRPPSPIIGQYYLDTTLGKPVWWLGSAWIDATGATA